MEENERINDTAGRVEVQDEEEHLNEQIKLENQQKINESSSSSSDSKNDISKDCEESIIIQTSLPFSSSSPPPPPPIDENNDQSSKIVASQLEDELKKLNLILQQKDSTIQLLEREKNILEKEKHSLKIETDHAIKEKENAVMRFATKEKDLLDAKKESSNLLKQLNDSKKEIKNITTKYHSINDEKSRLTGMLEEKFNELRRQCKENEKLKTDFSNLEMKFKWNAIKLSQEAETRQALEKKLEEYVDRTPKNVPKFPDTQRIEQEANLILLKHENDEKEKIIDNLRKEQHEMEDKLSKLQDSFSIEIKMKNEVMNDLKKLQEEHNSVQNTLSQEILISAKLRSELEANKILKAQYTINEEKLQSIENTLKEKERQISDFESQILHLRSKESELLAINKEMSEMIVDLQNQIYLQNSKIKAIEAEKALLQKDKTEFDSKFNNLQLKLNDESQKRNEERLVLTRHLSEKTKLYEVTKNKLDNVLGDLEVTKKKHSQIVKELNRELNKYRKHSNELHLNHKDNEIEEQNQLSQSATTISTSANQLDNNIVENSSTTITENNKTIQEPSKEHLVERILRLQQAAARQTEKIDFLENHTMSLVAELQKKSKILQYYMLRDQAGALTSSKSDQNKTELAKYGGVMSAIYTGIRGSNQSMTLDLSLEINKKLQAVLEDTLLKNITLKENLDVLGLEVDKLTRQLAKYNNVGSENLSRKTHG